MSEKVSRRGYVKYAAAGVIVIAGAAAGGYYYSQRAPTVEEKVKVAYLMNESKDDGSWCAWNVADANAIQTAFGEAVEVTTQELIEWPDMEKTLRDYAEKGYKVVYGCGFQWGEPIGRMNEDYPETQFVYTCYSTGKEPNAASIFWREEEGGFLNGAMAGLLGATKVGIVGAMTAPCVNSFGNAVYDGLKHVGAGDVEVFNAYVGSWMDMVRGKEITEAMIEGGADYIAQDAAMTGLGIFEACAKNKVNTMGFYRNQNDVAGIGDNCVASILYLNFPAMKDMVDNIVA
ncbi:MAG: BMP family ABC transporter substrate-binding protein, partial [Candidatus Hodarchaeota archaeon]